MSINRTDLIFGLKELANWYATNPDVPLPRYPDFTHCVLADDDETGVRIVEQVAAALGVEVQYGHHVGAERSFSGLRFRVYYVRREVAEDFALRQRIARAATPEQLAAMAGVVR